MWLAGYCAGAGLGGFLLMTGLWVGLLIVVVWAVSRLFPVTGRRSRVADRLARQLAEGDVDPETYRQLQHDLAGSDRR